MSRAMISTAAVATPSIFGLLARPTRHRRAIQALHEDRHHATSPPPGGRCHPLPASQWYGTARSRTNPSRSCCLAQSARPTATSWPWSPPTWPPSLGDHRTLRRPLVPRAELPRTQGGPWAGPLRRARLGGLAPPRDPGLGRARLSYPAAAATPKTGGVGLSLWQLLGGLQVLLACWAGACPVCKRPAPRWLRRTGRPHVPT